jgi:hypothetical protein
MIDLVVANIPQSRPSKPRQYTLPTPLRPVPVSWQPTFHKAPPISVEVYKYGGVEAFEVLN